MIYHIMKQNSRKQLDAIELHEAETFGLSVDVVDDLTGKKLGRASSGTFRTADVVGLDTMAHVVKTLQDNLDEKSDPFYASFGTPPVLKTLIEMGHLGQKSKAGFYKKVGRDILRFDLAGKEYVPGGEKADAVYERMLKKPAGEGLKLLRNAEGAQGGFLWAILRKSFHYAAVHLATIADTAADVDLAMRWGFGMKQGARDYPVVQAVVLVASIAFVLANLCAEIAYSLADPRIRYG